MTAVLDASFLSRAFLESQFSPEAEASLRRLVGRGEPLVGPYTLHAEFASTVRGLERRGLVTQARADAALVRFQAIGLYLSWEADWVRTALDIARRVGASRIYDSLYLACADDFNAELYTCDARFVRSFGNDVPERIRLVES